MQNPEDLTAPASWDRPRTMELELKLDVARRDWLPQCLEATIRTCELIEEGVVPEVLHGFMLRSTAMRLLRCIYGDDLTAAASVREHVLRDAAREQEIDAYIQAYGYRRGLAMWEKDSLAKIETEAQKAERLHAAEVETVCPICGGRKNGRCLCR